MNRSFAALTEFYAPLKSRDKVNLGRNCHVLKKYLDGFFRDNGALIGKWRGFPSKFWQKTINRHLVDLWFFSNCHRATCRWTVDSRFAWSWSVCDFFCLLKRPFVFINNLSIREFKCTGPRKQFLWKKFLTFIRFCSDIQLIFARLCLTKQALSWLHLQTTTTKTTLGLARSLACNYNIQIACPAASIAISQW